MTLEQAHASLVAAITAAKPVRDFDIFPNATDYENAAAHVAEVGRIFADYLAAIMADAECSFPGDAETKEEAIDVLREAITVLSVTLMRDAERIAEDLPRERPMQRNFSSKSWNQA